MSQAIISESNLTAIANAIRAKNGSSATYTPSQMATAIAAIPSGIGTLISTTSLGTLSTTSTSAVDTTKSLSISNVNSYDLLIIDISVDSVINNRHVRTVSMILLTGTSTISTKNTVTVSSNKWNEKTNSSGTYSSRQGTTAYGIYANSGTLSNGTLTVPIYYRYNSTSTGTINGSYTARVYGVKLYDLING